MQIFEAHECPAWCAVTLLAAALAACSADDAAEGEAQGGSSGAGAAGNAGNGGSSGAGAGAAGGVGGAGGSSSGASGGLGGQGGSGGSSPEPDASDSGGTSGAAGTGGDSGAGGSGGSDGGAACTRESLTALIDGYFKALTAHDPAPLPVTANVKFTENAQVQKLGEGLLWKSAGALAFKRNLLDTERCGSLSHGVIDNGGTATIIGVRLKVEGAKISEVESYVVDPSNGFFPTPEGVKKDGGADWEGILPPAERSTRDVLSAAADAYFDLFSDSSTMVPFGTPCDRFENGFQTTRGQCSTGIPGGVTITNRRYVIADLEAGIAVGFVRFGSLLDFHMFKVKSGKIMGIHALVGPSARSSGWE